MTEQVVQKIEQRGYWRVIIRPLRFEQEKIKSLPECASLVEACMVRLRGWPYPYVRPNEIRWGEDWAQGQVDWKDHIELWRMYQSGQFAHMFAFYEDWWSENEFTSEDLRRIKPMTVMDFIMDLYSLTEIYEFAARLAEKGIFEDELDLEIELHAMKDRRLISINRMRYIPDNFICASTDLRKSLKVSVQEVLGRARQLALDHTVWLFQRFGWRSPPRDILKEDQERLFRH